MIDYEKLMGLKRAGERFSYTDRETLLYAVSVGMGRDPLDANELSYVYEQSALRTVPSMATVLTRIPLLKDCGYDYTKVVHGEQRLSLHRPLPPQGNLIADAHVVAAYDKGPGKGALIYTQTDVRLADGGQALYTLLSATFARGDGGFGGPAGSGPAPHPIPARAPDLTESFETRADQALLYRLNGALDVRFSKPVYPGETIETDLWLDGSAVSFRCRIPQRDGAVVIDHGRCLLG